MIAQGLQASMLLWIPSNVQCDLEWEERARQATAANGAVLDFCNQEISFADMLDQVEFYDANIDDYLASLSESLRIFGA